MCGRFTMTGPQDAVLDAVGPAQLTFDYRPRFNIAPTQDVAALVRGGEGARIGLLRWGLVPHWSDGPSIGSRLINARAETVAEKPSFRDAFHRRRCLVLADGFYAWSGTDQGGKAPVRIHFVDDRPFAFAGLWERWIPPEGGEPIHSCVIITAGATPALRPIHPRMPVILPPDARDAWLAPDTGRDELLDLLRPHGHEAELEAYPVSTVVNSPKNDGPGCVAPL